MATSHTTTLISHTSLVIQDAKTTSRRVTDMPNQEPTFFIVPRPYRETQWTGFLDMLRYDGATVEDHGSNYVILRTSSGRMPTEGRWSSFGLPVMFKQREWLDKRTMLDAVKDRLLTPNERQIRSS